ncbi:MAG: outer membrane protein assembly factor BamA, partial [Desulfobacteraceae bacterium]|nr:outer membrane protein assembly factor BamA [Desulfobacteraceae bacterium]
MGKRLLPFMIVWGCLVAATAAAQESASVLVLPFDINAPEDFNYLQKDIPKAIERNLAAEGANILEPGASTTPRPITADDQPLRGMGRESGADFVVWGSFTRIGQQFSLDAKIVETFSNTPAEAVYAEGRSIEDLARVVQELTRKLGVLIFKQQTVAGIVVEGNRRIEADAIKRVIRISPGDVYQAQDVSRDLKAIYDMGYFDDIRVEAEEGPQGKTLIFKVKEKPTIRIIRFKGNDVFDEDELTENLSISTGAILNIFKLEQNVQRIKTLYEEKNYHNAKVT